MTLQEYDIKIKPTKIVQGKFFLSWMLRLEGTNKTRVDVEMRKRRNM